jgi:hypothetical protein
VRWGLISWILFGLALLGVKAMLDVSSGRYPDVAVRAGASTYFIPRTLILNGDTFSADLARVSGCWDAREAGMVQATASIAGCERPRALHLDLSGVQASHPFAGRHMASVAFWRNYSPPVQHMQELAPQIGRVPTYERAGWKMLRIDLPGSPWVYLFSRAPQSAEDAQRVYAGRCYRSDIGTDIGMTCTVVERLAGDAALEYALGPEGVAEMAQVRADALSLLAKWRRRDAPP